MMASLLSFYLILVFHLFYITFVRIRIYSIIAQVTSFMRHSRPLHLSILFSPIVSSYTTYILPALCVPIVLLAGCSARTHTMKNVECIKFSFI